jgi:Archaeal Peptidase A24 C-terminus Type II.
MYLRWRGCTLAELRADPTLRSPDTVTETFPPTDGARHREPEWPRRRDGGPASGDPTPPDEWAGTGFVPATVRRVGGDPEPDPWAAAAFLDDIDGSAYGTTPDRLRAGLERLTTAERVWVSPGLPFVVPLFGGLVVALTLGDVGDVDAACRRGRLRRSADGYVAGSRSRQSVGSSASRSRRS